MAGTEMIIRETIPGSPTVAILTLGQGLRLTGGAPLRDDGSAGWGGVRLPNVICVCFDNLGSEVIHDPGEALVDGTLSRELHKSDTEMERADNNVGVPDAHNGYVHDGGGMKIVASGVNDFIAPPLKECQLNIDDLDLPKRTYEHQGPRCPQSLGWKWGPLAKASPNQSHTIKCPWSRRDFTFESRDGLQSPMNIEVTAVVPSPARNNEHVAFFRQFAAENTGFLMGLDIHYGTNTLNKPVESSITGVRCEYTAVSGRLYDAFGHINQFNLVFFARKPAVVVVQSTPSQAEVRIRDYPFLAKNARVVFDDQRLEPRPTWDIWR
ncbi:hypothetical protein IW262DRAFT_1451136 [Armillaria fumosa]|nr:hypothetical protein IW262DRAFT_1451136 [Armillaria fumosa]